MCPFDYTAVAVSGNVESSLTGLSTPAGMVVVNPTDRPKSVHSRCEIDVLVGFLCWHVAFWIFLSRSRSFCLKSESDLCLFLLK